MKRLIQIQVYILVLCGPLSFACSISSGKLIAGPENTGLRMRLAISNAEGGKPDVYQVQVELINVSSEAVTLVAQWYYEQQGGYPDYLKEAICFVSYPEVMPETAQSAGMARNSPQPECTIQSGESLKVEWVSAPRSLKPEGYYCTSPTFPCDGLYGVRAVLMAISKDGQRILLTSNEQQVFVGGNSKMPKYAVAQIVQCDPDHKKVILNLGSDQKIEPNDKFEATYLLGDRWTITIIEVNNTTSTGLVEEIGIASRDTPWGSKAPTFPQAGWKVKLLPCEKPTN